MVKEDRERNRNIKATDDEGKKRTTIGEERTKH